MEKLKTQELKKDLFIGDLGDRFRDYDKGFICDIISEIADNNIDMYTVDLLEWAKNNFSYIEEGLDEYGTPTDSNGKADFLRIIQQGQYIEYEHDLYDNLEDSLIYFMYDYIEKDLEILELTEEQNDNLLDFDFTDNNKELENLIDHIKEVLQIEE